MASSRPQSASSSDAAHRDEARAAASQSLALVAERELLAALGAQTPPAFGAHTRPSLAEVAAFDHAVGVLCREAHRLDLHAEELVIAIKQAWLQLGPIRASRLGEWDGDVLRQIVSSSIEVFFESREADDRRTQH